MLPNSSLAPTKERTNIGEHLRSEPMVTWQKNNCKSFF